MRPLIPEWGNTADNVAIFRIPRGTTIFEGNASSQGGVWVGGKKQIYIQEVSPDWIIGIRK